MNEYIEIRTKESVPECVAFDYVLDRLGLIINEQEDNKEQLEFKEMLVEWYFSGNWIKQKMEED